MTDSADKWTAQEALASGLAAQRELRKLGLGSQIDDANVVAQNVLHEELGYFPKSTLATYSLSEATRDRLIVHARQDAATAMIHGIELRKQTERIERMIINSRRLLLAIGVWVLLICAKVLS